jgi:phenylacetate-CoA ligase
VDHNRIWDPEHETMPRDTLGQLQLERLQVTLNRAMRNVAFYRERFAPLDFVPDGVRSLEDLARLPMTSRDDLREGYPYGFFAVPMREVVRIDTAPGLTRSPTVSAYTSHDLDRWAQLTARVLTAAGVTADSVVQIPFETGMFDSGFGFLRGAQLIGASVISVPGEDYARQIRMMHDYRTTVLIAMPSDALRLADELAHSDRPRGLWLETALLGGEPWSEAMRVEIEERLGARATDNYWVRIAATPGVAFECPARCGLHINEDHFLAEIIDPETLEPLPPGSEGELVLTTLEKEALPVIRHRTGDICSLVTEPCECGRTFARITRPRTRTDDRIVVRGVSIQPLVVAATIEEALGTTPTYQIVVGEERPDDVQVRLVAPAQEAGSEETLVRLARDREQIEREMTVMLGIQVRVNIVERTSLIGPADAPPTVVDLRVTAL